MYSIAAKTCCTKSQPSWICLSLWLPFGACGCLSGLVAAYNAADQTTMMWADIRSPEPLVAKLWIRGMLYQITKALMLPSEIGVLTDPLK